MRGRRVAAWGPWCDLAHPRGARDGLEAGEPAEPVLGHVRALEGCAAFGGPALAGPEARGGGRLAGAHRLAGRSGLGAFGGHEPDGRYAARRVTQARFSPPSRVLPDRASVLVRRWWLVGSYRLAELGAGLVAAFPVVVGASEGLAGRLAAGRAQGRALAHVRVVPFRREVGRLPPVAPASIGLVWCYGDLDIGRVLPPPGGGSGGTTWDRSAGGTGVLGANRGSKAA